MLGIKPPIYRGLVPNIPYQFQGLGVIGQNRIFDTRKGRGRMLGLKPSIYRGLVPNIPYQFKGLGVRGLNRKIYTSKVGGGCWD